MIDFPNSPTVGQVVSSPSGTAWRWTGSTWLLGTAASAGGARGTVAYAQITANIVGMTTLADIPGLAVTFTAVAGRCYKVTGAAMVQVGAPAAANESGSFRVANGAGSMRQSKNFVVAQPATNYGLHVEHVTSGADSGTTTYKLQYGRAQGTGAHTIVADPTIPAFILVEDITYDAGPGGAVVPAQSTVSGRWRRVTGIVAPVSTMYTMTWDTEDYDTDNMHVPGPGNGTILIPKPGLYAISGQISFASAVAPNGMVRLSINTVNVASSDYPATAVGQLASWCRTEIFAAGDQIIVSVFHSVAGGCTVSGTINVNRLYS